MTRKRDIGLALIALAIILTMCFFGPQPAYPQAPPAAPTDFAVSAWPDLYLSLIMSAGEQDE